MSHWHVTLGLRAEDPVGPVIECCDGPWPEPPEGVISRREEHLLQWVSVLADGTVEGHYVFDEGYVSAHPESVDMNHLAMLHALLCFKLFDDGVVVVPPAQVAGSLRWPALGERRKTFSLVG